MHQTRAFVCAAAATLLSCSLATLTATPAAAATAVTCEGTLTLNYDPGLTLQPQTVTASGFTTYSCVANGVPVEADIDAEATLSNATCTSVALPSAYSETVRWRDTEDEPDGDAAFSDITYTTASVIRVPEGTAAVFSGTVTQGRYEEAAVQKTLLISNDNQLVACLTPDGLTSTTGPTAMQITAP